MKREFFEALNLDNKTAVVTGASRGLGRAIAIALASAGANVFLSARNRTLLEETSDIIKREGGKTEIFVSDVSEKEGAERIIDNAVKTFGSIDVLVNNAGILIEKPAIETDKDDWFSVINTNLSSTFFASVRLARHIIEKKKKGSIINIASNFGVMGVNRLASYCAAKGGIISLTKSLAVEWARFGIRVNCIAPGYFLTDMSREILTNDKTKPIVIGRIPLKRAGDVSEIGHLVVYLASDASSFMTGETIFIDGGHRINW